jgi:hypothetical protein
MPTAANARQVDVPSGLDCGDGFVQDRPARASKKVDRSLQLDRLAENIAQEVGHGLL